MTPWGRTRRILDQWKQGPQSRLRSSARLAWAVCIIGTPGDKQRNNWRRIGNMLAELVPFVTKQSHSQMPFWASQVCQTTVSCASQPFENRPQPRFAPSHYTTRSANIANKPNFGYKQAYVTTLPIRLERSTSFMQDALATAATPLTVRELT